MRVTLLQSNLVWENKAKNLSNFEHQIQNISSETDLIILPEMFTTGFSMKVHQLAEEHLGPSFQVMQTWARTTKSAVLGSLIVRDKHQYFNRAYFVFSDGSFQFYDKRHLFRMAKEDNYFTAGEERLIVEYKGWRIMPLVCYDLRFPVWSRNNLSYDLLVYMANWPERRALPWKTLLRARAIENLAYVAGVNRIGEDGNGVRHSGDSTLINFKGEELTQIKPHHQQSETIELSKSDLTKFRTKFPAQLDADHFIID